MDISMFGRRDPGCSESSLSPVMLSVQRSLALANGICSVQYRFRRRRRSVRCIAADSQYRRRCGCICGSFRNATEETFLEVYDAMDNLLGKISFAGALPTGASEATAFETITFTSASVNIRKIRFSSEQTEGGSAIYGLFDTLAFAGEPANPTNNVPERSMFSLLGIGALGLLGRASQRKCLQISV
jgi:hypothetical protein